MFVDRVIEKVQDPWPLQPYINK